MGSLRARLRDPGAGPLSEFRRRAAFPRQSTESGVWTVFDKRDWPGGSLADQLGFALRHEHTDFLISKRLCDAAPADAFAELVARRPQRTRRAGRGISIST